MHNTGRNGARCAVVLQLMTQSSDARETRASAAEIKFLVDPALGAIIRTWARARLGPDPHGTGEFGDQYRTASVYFDTPGFDVFYRRGSFGRSKYRARRYDRSEVVYLERKLTKPGLVTKRRTRVEQKALGRLLHVEQVHLEQAHLEQAHLKQAHLKQDSHWAGEWFRRRLQLRCLRPVCQVSYQRTARVGSTDLGPIRLTLDENVRALALDAVSFETGAGTSVLDGQLILELKYSVEMPAVFKELLEMLALVPQTASKYRLGVAALGAVPPAHT